jgi:hypothetical protein
MPLCRIRRSASGVTGHTLTVPEVS